MASHWNWILTFDHGHSEQHGHNHSIGSAIFRTSFWGSQASSAFPPPTICAHSLLIVSFLKASWKGMGPWNPAQAPWLSPALQNRFYKFRIPAPSLARNDLVSAVSLFCRSIFHHKMGERMPTLPSSEGCCKKQMRSWLQKYFLFSTSSMNIRL